jgi:hypothetical protein
MTADRHAAQRRPQATNPNAALADLMVRGYQAQTNNDLEEAERLYRAALALNPNTFDALHMLGVIRLQQGDAEEAVRLLLAALPLLRTDYPPIYRNLGLCLAAVARRRRLAGATAPDEHGRAYESFFRDGNLPAMPDEPPLVSIVMPCAGGNGSVEAAISSITQQTYRNIELIVVGCGQQAERSNAVERELPAQPLPARFVSHVGGSVHQALNAGVESAQGRYVGIIEGDGLYRPDRVEKFVRILTGSRARWGFSNIAFIDDRSNPVRYGESPVVDTVMRDFDALYACHAVSAGVLEHDCPLTAGNLFFEKALWQEAGGFPSYRHCAAWAFSLAAILVAEPAYLDEPAYLLRLAAGGGFAHGNDEARVSERSEIAALWEREHGSLQGASNATLHSSVQPQRRMRDFSMMADGLGDQIDRGRMLRYAVGLGFTTALAV